MKRLAWVVAGALLIGTLDVPSAWFARKAAAQKKSGG
jgi:hypothetical protein